MTRTVTLTCEIGGLPLYLKFQMNYLQLFFVDADTEMWDVLDQEGYTEQWVSGMRGGFPWKINC